MPNPGFWGEVTVPTAGWAMNVTGTTKTVPAANYWMHSATLAKSLVSKVGDLLDDVDAGNSASMATTGTNKGRVTIVLATGQTLAWTATDLRDALGFTGNLVAGTNLAPNQARYCWWPNTPITRALYPLGQVGPRRSDAVQVRAPDGTVYTTKFVETRENDFLVELVEDRYAIEGKESLLNESFERLWRDAISLGRKLKVVWDEADQASETAGKFAEYAPGERVVAGGAAVWKPHIATFEKWWDLGIDVSEFV